MTGASGLVGTALAAELRAAGDTVNRFVRASADAAAGASDVPWNPETGDMNLAAAEGTDAVVNLAGASIGGGRWTPKRKALLRSSRVDLTERLVAGLGRLKSPPKIFISASAIGYYGDRGDEVLREESAAGAGFLAEVCREWEEAAAPAVQAGIRTAHLRTGIVLSPKGGALGAMLVPFRLGLGGRTGDGRQWMSWIDVQDMVGGILHILKNEEMRGPVNMVAPAPVTNAEFAKTLASVLRRPAIFPMPAFVAKLAFGEMGEELLLGSQKVEPGKLISSGYLFRYRELRASLEGLLARNFCLTLD